MDAAEILTRMAAELALFAGVGFLLFGLNDLGRRRAGLSAGERLARAVRPNRACRAAGYRCLDIDGIEARAECPRLHAAIVKLPNQIGVLWSNQTTRRFGFRLHHQSPRCRYASGI